MGRQEGLERNKPKHASVSSSLFKVSLPVFSLFCRNCGEKIMLGQNLNSVLQSEWKEKKSSGNVRQLQEIK